MARLRFLNPNEPEQPARGIYRWYCVRDREEFTLYVGSAGRRERGISSPSTLRRGILEATRSCLTSDQGFKLDTDFIVGTAIQYFKSEGFDCCWEHISDRPDEEKLLCSRYRPLLQDKNAQILSAYKLAKPNNGTWDSGDTLIAEQLLFERLASRTPSTY